MGRIRSTLRSLAADLCAVLAFVLFLIVLNGGF